MRLLLMFMVCLLCSCMVVPTTVEQYDPDCKVVTKHMKLKKGPEGKFSECHDTWNRSECGVGQLVSLGLVSAGSVVVSGSIVVVGNVVYWFEKVGACQRTELSEGMGVTGSVWSDQAHFVERIRMDGQDKLVNEMTVEDPLALTEPWKLMLNYKRVTDIDRMIDEDCIGNERNFTEDGQQIVILK